MEKEGLDSGMSHAVEELNLLKRNLAAQANVGHEKRKYPSYWTLNPDGKATSGRFRMECPIFKAGLQKLVSDSFVSSRLQKLALKRSFAC